MNLRESLTNFKVRVGQFSTLRNRYIFVLDLLATLITPAIALTLRLDHINWWANFGQGLVLFTIISICIKLPIFYRIGLYRRYWRYATISDLVLIMTAVSLTTATLTLLFTTPQTGLTRLDFVIPRTLPLIDGMLTILTAVGFRLGLRGLYHYHQRHDVVRGRRVLIMGAGEAGSLVAREMRANPQLEMEPIIFVDDDQAKLGTYIQGIPVLGANVDIPALVKQYHIQRIVVAIPSASLGRQQEITAACQQTGLTTYSLPGVYQLLAGHKTISQSPQVDIHQLLRRSPVTTDQTQVEALLRGSVVLVTGAGGSIGSELCRQIARCQPAKLILLGHGENSIFEIGLDLRLNFPEVMTRSAIVDVRDQARVNRVIDKYRPKVIFHAAAHKHVPFMQDNVEEALTNNVVGTQIMLQAAEQYDVAHFVFISTDKAVNPANIMGATKRLAELLVIGTAQRTGQAYMAVRFGNVLGSRGSVIPIFQRQIAAGGPLTITHPNMKRYFMTIPEAVQLVLQASVLGQGEDIFVLDMGQQVRILDLALDLIRLSGLEPERDIKIIYSGIRPGEKLAEQLFLEGENYRRTDHSKIFTTSYHDNIDLTALEQTIGNLVSLTRQLNYLPPEEQVEILLTKICEAIETHQVQTTSPLTNRHSQNLSPDAPYPRPLSARI